MHQKSLIIILIILVIIVVSTLYIFHGKTTQLSVAGIKGETDCDNVTVQISDSSDCSKSPCVRVMWVNNTSEPICFGQEFFLYQIYDNQKKPVPRNEKAVWEDILYCIEPHTHREQMYSLQPFTSLTPGTYCIEQIFWPEQEGNTTYSMQVILELS